MNPLTIQQRNITRRDRKAADILNRIGELRHNLVLMYEDIPGLRPVELQALTAPPKGKGDELAEFYSRFEKIKDFHKRNTNINARQLINEIEEMVQSDGLQKVQVEGEEEPIIVDREFTSFCSYTDASFGQRLLGRRDVRPTPGLVRGPHAIPEPEGKLTLVVRGVHRHAATWAGGANIGLAGKGTSCLSGVR